MCSTSITVSYFWSNVAKMRLLKHIKLQNHKILWKLCIYVKKCYYQCYYHNAYKTLILYYIFFGKWFKLFFFYFQSSENFRWNIFVGIYITLLLYFFKTIKNNDYDRKYVIIIFGHYRLINHYSKLKMFSILYYNR